jgi:hypothetical protein
MDTSLKTLAKQRERGVKASLALFIIKYLKYVKLYKISNLCYFFNSLL